MEFETIEGRSSHWERSNPIGRSSTQRCRWKCQLGAASMRQADVKVPTLTEEAPGPDEVVKLIRKLRWIGSESQARELQAILGRFRSPHWGSLMAGPHSTD